MNFLRTKTFIFSFFLFFFSIHFAFYQKFFLDRIHWNSLEMDVMRINWTKFISSVNMAIEFSKINSKKFIYFIYHDILFLISFRNFHCSSGDHFIITFIRIFSPLNFFHFDLFVALDPSLSNSFSNDISKFPGSTKRVHTSDSTKSPATPTSKESTRESAPVAKCHRVESRVTGYDEWDESVMFGPPSEASRAGRSYGIDVTLNNSEKPSRLCQSSLCPMKIKGKKKKKNMFMGELFSGRNSIQIKSEQRSTGTWPESFYRFPFPSSSWRRRAAKTNGGGWTELSLKAEGTIEDYKGYIGVSGIRRRRIIKLEDEGLDYLEEENEILLSSSKFFREV